VLLFLRRHVSFSLTLKRFFQFSRVLYITHVFPRDAVSSILAAEQQQREQQSAFYETTKKNEQNLSRDVFEYEFEVVVSKNRRRKRKSPDIRNRPRDNLVGRRELRIQQAIPRERFERNVQKARECKVNFFDTAEVYGYKNTKFEQSSEHILSRCREEEAEDESEVVIGSKVFTIPWTNALLGGGFRLGKESLVLAGKESVKRMNNRPMDLWSIHFPFPSFSQEVLMSALEESLDLGLTKAVGVSNYNKEQLEKAYDILDKRGIPLASNQVEYSILNRKAEKEGLLRSCQDRDVKVVAYSPLKALKTTEIAEKYVIMNKLCDFIGQVNSGGKSSVSVMLNYCVTKGTIPIPGVKKVEQIADIENAMGWTLDEESLLTIDEKMDYLDGL
jgi:aryl-alcohol dehydrogenase-like predicted oxidoreductase